MDDQKRVSEDRNDRGREMKTPNRLAVLGAVIISAGMIPVGAALGAASGAANEAAGQRNGGIRMKITVTSVLVDDQAKALKFYTEVLGFVKKADVTAGEYRWLTVISPDQPNGPELLLEPMGFPPAKTFQKALFDAGIPLTMFDVDDIKATYEKLKKLGVVFKTVPTQAGPVKIAVFEDTCGNLIQIVQR
jgi:catechol 2,3-dioxygenase-like lactoylglutathione lyase family enzyme